MVFNNNFAESLPEALLRTCARSEFAFAPPPAHISRCIVMTYDDLLHIKFHIHPLTQENNAMKIVRNLACTSSTLSNEAHYGTV
jgi:hypothetical protein